MRATTILAIVAIVAGIGAVGISTHLAQAMMPKPPPPPPMETNPSAGNPHTLNGDNGSPEPTGNPHQGTLTGCQKGDPHSESGPPGADEAFCNGAK